MPFVSESQRRYMHANHPEIAERWEHEYPRKKKKLPKHVKKAFEEGVDEAVKLFGLGRTGKFGAEEIRLKIPKREFHGFDAAFTRAATEANDKTKKAEDQDDEVTMPLPPQASEDHPVEKLVAVLQQLPDPKDTNIRETNQDTSENQSWSAPRSIPINDTPGTTPSY